MLFSSAVSSIKSVTASHGWQATWLAVSSATLPVAALAAPTAVDVAQHPRLAILDDDTRSYLIDSNASAEAPFLLSQMKWGGSNYNDSNLVNAVGVNYDLAKLFLHYQSAATAPEPTSDASEGRRLNMVDLARGLIRYTAIPIAASSVAGTAVGLATSARFGFLASFMTLAISILLLNALTNAKPGRD